MTGTTSLHDGYKPYDAAFVNKTQTTIYGGQYGTIYLSAQAMVTVEDGAVIDVIDSCAITSTSYGKLTIGEGAKVGTINLTPTGAYKPAIAIKAGAEVGTIVYEGTPKDKHPDNFIVEAGAKIGTIVYKGNNPAFKIQINEGAEVGKIVYMDTEYTVAEWMAR
jgi:hypothetical protein